MARRLIVKVMMAFGEGDKKEAPVPTVNYREIVCSNPTRCATGRLPLSACAKNYRLGGECTFEASKVIFS